MARHIVIVAYEGVQLLDVVGPLEVFALAERFARDDGELCQYRIEVATTHGVALTASDGLTIQPHRALRSVPKSLDTIIVAGGEGTRSAATDPELLAWLRRRARTSRRVASVCSGAFVLAAAGLLDGRHATTHWSECDQLARLYPSVVVEPDPIFVRDGNVATSAGVTAGMDLALAFVEEDLGRDAALRVARWMVLFVRRPGGQSQFSAQLAAQQAHRSPLRELQTYIVEHPDADLSVGALAARASMSERNFARVFARELGATPGDYVERSRVEVARRLLEDTGLDLDAIASGSGFGSVETLRRAFHRRISVAPSDYRARFRSIAS